MDDEDESKLNVNSASFDPFLALYSDHVVVPRPDALVLDNVAKFESLYSQSKNSSVRIDEIFEKTKPKKKEPEPTTSKELQSRFQSSQVPVSPSKERKGKPLKNVLTRISKASGPLAFLRSCMEKRIRVKVWTRNATGIRGYCLGFVIAFDSHWNLALTDVKEVWSRKVKRKTIPLVRECVCVASTASGVSGAVEARALDDGTWPYRWSPKNNSRRAKKLKGVECDLPREWKAMGPMVTPPKVVILKTEKGVQTCERHVSQMLMRGEHIAFISVTDA